MKVVNVVGKVDTRPIIYPLIRALALKGQVGVITDDGAYRRLFHGLGNIGSVSGVDIGVCGHVTDENIDLLKETGINYDYLIIVGTDYLNTSSDGILVCHGVDRSMMASCDADNTDDDLILIEDLKKRMDEMNKDSENNEESGKKSLKHGHKAKESSDEEVVEQSEKAETSIELAKPEDQINNSTKDKIIIPKGTDFVECQIGYAAAPKNGIIGISLKDGHMQYVYNCEEMKQLLINGDKNLNTLLAKVAEKLLGIDSKEMSTLLTRDETVSGEKKKK